MAYRAESSAGTVLALQAVELKRLLRENKALSDRVDTLIGEISRMRSLHENEQAQRRRLQDAVVDLIEKALAPPVPQPPAMPHGGRHGKPPLREITGGQDAPRGAAVTGLAAARQCADLQPPEIPAFLRRAAP